MKIGLIGINSKYIHKSLSIHSLHAWVRDLPHEFSLLEFTINEPLDKIFHKLHREGFDVLSFSVYVWNRELVQRLGILFRSLSPQTKIVVGGPEISSSDEGFSFADHLIVGEGEEPFRRLLESAFQAPRILSPEGGSIDLDALPFPYEDCLDKLENRIVYYEGSRGCPFRCSYCLSGSDERLRLKSVPKILEEVGRLAHAGVRQVKFIDRTFNADPRWAMEVIRGLLPLAPFGCNFHFEVSVDKMDPGVLALLEKAPDGLFQLEIGIQTTNEETLKAIGRRNDFGKIRDGVERLLAGGNMHLHTDLIAGLPYEGLESFRKSFNEIASLKAPMLQVGFLKVIPNTRMHREAPSLGIRYRPWPPYEVLETPWLPVAELLEIQYVEEAVEAFHNKPVFRQTMTWLLDRMEDPFAFFGRLGKFLFDLENPLSLEGKFGFLYEFAGREIPEADREELLGRLRLDWYLNSRDRRAPFFLRGERELEEFLPRQGRDKAFLKAVVLPFRIEASGFDFVAVERKPSVILFDYREKRTAFRYPVLQELQDPSCIPDRT